MEKKKALWISLAAGIFLLTVCGAAAFKYRPYANNDVYAASLKGTDNIWVSPVPEQKPQSYPITVTNSNSPSDAGQGIYAPKQEENPLSSDSGDALALQPQPVTQTAPSTISLSTETSGTATAPASVTAQNATTEKAMEDAKAAAATTAKATAKNTTAATPKASTAKTAAKAPAAQKKPAAGTAAKAAASTTTQYWVQVSSYSAKKNADEARSVLDSNSLPCEVFTYTKDGTMYYRVRVGPYAAKGEAEKAKTKVDGITLFKSAGSYVVSAKKEN